jgi:hypothetical protein
MGYVGLQMLSSFSSEAPTDFRDAYIATDATVHTDGLKAFNLFGEGSGSDGRANATQPFLTVNTLIAKSQHRPQGNLHGILAKAPARLSLRLLLEHQPAPQHARYGRCPQPSHRNLFPPHP